TGAADLRADLGRGVRPLAAAGPDADRRLPAEPGRPAGARLPPAADGRVLLRRGRADARLVHQRPGAGRRQGRQGRHGSGPEEVMSAKVRRYESVKVQRSQGAPRAVSLHTFTLSYLRTFAPERSDDARSGRDPA